MVDAAQETSYTPEQQQELAQLRAQLDGLKARQTESTKGDKALYTLIKLAGAPGDDPLTKARQHQETLKEDILALKKTKMLNELKDRMSAAL